jgi:8-oxo-dGTP diphosphatase / 2-hydroxy-dATP diphosphatase
MKKILTLCFAEKDGATLLGMKKRGFGEGRYNGFGGKVHEGETIVDAAKRELFEECSLVATSLEKIGIVEFSYDPANREEVMQVHVFKVHSWEGEPAESEEMTIEWFPTNEMPFEKMWPDDAYWFPLFAQGKKFKGEFIFDTPGGNFTSYTLEEVESME